MKHIWTALRGKTVSVIGIGVSNRPLIEKLLEKGVARDRRDKKESLGELGAELAAQGCKLKLGEDYLKDIHEDVIFRTPGLRPDVPELPPPRQGAASSPRKWRRFLRSAPARFWP